MSAFLRARVAEKAFATNMVLRDLELRLRRRELVSLIGPSGCGKSTLLRIIAGLERDYLGEVSLHGRQLSGLTRDIGFVFQEPRLFPWLTVAENIAFDLGRHGDKDPLVSELLEEVGLAGLDDALPKQLSGGQAQRVSIARGLFTQPQLLLLDEPFSAVDAFTRMKLQDLLLAVARQHGITLLLVTHDVDEALYLSNRVLIMAERPGVIRGEVEVELSQPRDRRDPLLAQLKSVVLTELYAAQAI
jgi:sulfonate transport system ATP-binding protein